MSKYKKPILLLSMLFASCKAAHSKSLKAIKIKLEGEKEVVVQDSGRAIFIENPEFRIKYSSDGIKNIRFKFNIYRSEMYHATKENKDVFPYTIEDLLKLKPYVPIACVFVSNEKGNERLSKIFKDYKDINKFQNDLKGGKIKEFFDLRNYDFSLCEQKFKLRIK